MLAEEATHPRARAPAVRDRTYAPRNSRPASEGQCARSTPHAHTYGPRNGLTKGLTDPGVHSKAGACVVAPLDLLCCSSASPKSPRPHSQGKKQWHTARVLSAQRSNESAVRAARGGTLMVQPEPRGGARASPVGGASPPSVFGLGAHPSCDRQLGLAPRRCTTPRLRAQHWPRVRAGYTRAIGHSHGVCSPPGCTCSRPGL